MAPTLEAKVYTVASGISLALTHVSHVQPSRYQCEEVLLPVLDILLESDQVDGAR